jgi:spermidine synthase
MTIRSPSLPFILMGLTSMLLQITSLRLLLATFSGNELDIGITLSFWLIYVGLGSYAGRKIKFKNAFIISFIIIALLSLPTFLAIKAIRPALSLEPGEAVSLTGTILSTAVAIFPLCFAIGLQFPLAVSFLRSQNAAGKVYGLEAFGAFLGGLIFTFVISSRIGAMEVCLLVSFVQCITALYLSEKKIMAFFFIIPLIFYLSFHRTATALPWKGMKISQTAESRYGEIVAIKVGSQSSLYANGHLAYTYPEPQNEEMKAHIPMTLHQVPRNILVVGGSPGILKEFLKYRVDQIDFVELDPEIVKVSFRILKSKEDAEAVRNQHVQVIIQDARKYIKGLKKPVYDLIILNLPPPSTASINRFYTEEFFTEAKSVLRKEGILTVSIPSSSGYIGKRMQIAAGSVYNSLRSVFRYVEPTAQEYGIIFSSDSRIDTNTEMLEERFSSRAISTGYFHPFLLRDVFSPFGVGYVRQRLSEINSMNTDLRPTAYLHNVMLWAEINGGKTLEHLLKVKIWHVFASIPMLFAILSFFLFRHRNRIISFSVFSTGFSGMTFMIAIILAYQSIYGYIYETIGILSAAFMIGLWAGTSAAMELKRPLKTLLVLEIMTVLLAVVSLALFNTEVIFYFLAALAGVVAGAQFSAANLSQSGSPDGGRLYATDLIGSFTGALIPSLIVIPLFGIPSALILIALIKTFSAVMIASESLSG